MTLRARMLELADEGHPGVVRMKQRCRQWRRAHGARGGGGPGPPNIFKR